MTKNVSLRMLSLLCCALVGGNGWAQEPPREEGPLGVIREQMLSSAQENTRLLEENKALKAQLVSLQLEIEKFAHDISALDSGYIEAREASRRLKKSPEDFNENTLIHEAQRLYITGQMIESSPAQKLRELQLYDLQYEKQELQLDLKSIKFLSENLQERNDPELSALLEGIRSNDDRLRGLLDRIAQQEANVLVYPRQIELLEGENKALKMKIKQLKKTRR